MQSPNPHKDLQQPSAIIENNAFLGSLECCIRADQDQLHIRTSAANADIVQVRLGVKEQSVIIGNLKMELWQAPVLLWMCPSPQLTTYLQRVHLQP